MVRLIGPTGMERSRPLINPVSNATSTWEDMFRGKPEIRNPKSETELKFETNHKRSNAQVGRF
jgi:hypothetical protein